MELEHSEKMIALIWIDTKIRTAIIVDTKSNSLVSPIEFEYLVDPEMHGNGKLKYHTFQGKSVGYIDCRYPSKKLRQELHNGNYVKCSNVTAVQNMLNAKIADLFDMLEEIRMEEDSNEE